MRIDVFTLFPAMFFGPFQESILKRAQLRGLLTIVLHQIRDYAMDRHQLTDDVPYGGGIGMVMKPEPIFNAVESVMGAAGAPVILLSPQGRQFSHAIAQELAQQPRIALICGHYEGVDERVLQHLVTAELSIGDYVLTGGELAAMVIVDALARFIPGVLGAAEGASHDSFAEGLLEGPQYTRPPVYRTWEVPEILRSGHHEMIRQWQREASLQRTRERRSDLMAQADLTQDDISNLTKSGEPDEEQRNEPGQA